MTQVQAGMRQAALQPGVGQAEVSLLVLMAAPAQPWGTGLPRLLATCKGCFSGAVNICRYLLPPPLCQQ